MKKQIKKWAFRIGVTLLLITGLLLAIILNPILTYAGKTTHNNFTIYHDKSFDNSFLQELNTADLFLRSSSFYRPGIKYDICLNDGAVYPKLMRQIRGEAFAWGFYNKVVLQGKADYKNNTVELNGYKWNLSQLLAHELTHCLQFDKFGFFNSKPFANIPNWKWEGYAEYIARQSEDQKELRQNINRLKDADKMDPASWGINFSDNTISPRAYYNYWLLIQYCIDIKKMSYEQVLSDSVTEATTWKEMIDWYKRQ